MQTLWQSKDGFVVVVDAVELPSDDAAPEERGDLNTLFCAGAWIVVWRAVVRDRWRFTRNRRYAKPGFQALRRIMQRNRLAGGNEVFVGATDAHGHILDEFYESLSPIELGQALYEAWGVLALQAMPEKLKFLGLDPDDYDAARVPAWMRPGVLRHRQLRTFLRETEEEFGIQLAG
jgi:hypothetical protein